MNDITIKTASDIQLHNMVRRLRLEREAQQLILSIRRATKGDSEFDYLDSGVSTEEKISNLYHSGMIDPSDEFLEHFGVLGMKWGVRKDRSGGSNGGKQTRKEKKAEKKAKKRAERVKNKNKISKMSDTELRQKINRLQMEKQYTQLTAKEKSTGRKVVEGIVKTAATTTAANYVSKQLNNGVSIAEQVISKKMRG